MRPLLAKRLPPLQLIAPLKNGHALLILGLFLCIPLLTSVAAIILGIVGIRGTRNSAARGRGFASAGLTLGIIGALIWGAAGCIVLFLIVGSQAPRAVLHDFAANLTSGNIPAASALCDPSITPVQFDTLHTETAPFGTYSDLTCLSANLRASPSGEICTLTGTTHFSTGPRPFNAVLVKSVSGSWKIVGFHIN